ncbi:MAG: DUF1499 domain-containing protein [Alphaproteobacteria bacterium]|nr:DUF1499 domain-containing protein [Alphaproteobacteria bacterium]
MDPLSRIDFATLVRPRSPNTFLLAPDGLCAAAPVDRKASIYALPAARLRQAFLRVALATPRVSHVLSDDVGLYDNLVARSALLRFPDLIAARFVEAGGEKSTLAVYSRSVYGHSDLGVNRKRVLGWIEELRAFAEPVSR